VIKLSDAVQRLPRQTTQFVHGAAGVFLEIGSASAKRPAPRFTRGAYCLGKVVWGKGWEELLEILARVAGHGEALPPIDAYGSGEALDAIMERAESLRLPLNFLGRRDHLDESLREYKVTSAV
jgi:digalactosyldiacylglycerol synthase